MRERPVVTERALTGTGFLHRTAAVPHLKVARAHSGTAHPVRVTATGPRSLHERQAMPNESIPTDAAPAIAPVAGCGERRKERIKVR